jgi:hypothetical protein
MKCHILTVLIFLANTGSAQTFDAISSYKSMPASFIYKDSLYKYDVGNTLKKDISLNLPHDSSLLHILVDSYSTTTIYNVSTNGQLNILSNTASKEKSTYKVIYEYSQTQPVRLRSLSDDTSQMVMAVGISVRMVATLNTLNSNIDLSKLSSFITASGSRKKIDGFLEVKVVGIESKTITNLIPTPQTISIESIIAALQAMAAIKSHFNDNDIRIIPHVVGYYNVTDKTEVSSIRRMPIPAL